MKRVLVYNTALLTASSLLMQGIAMAFQVWLAGRIGPAGIGLYQLVLSVTGLCATFAISGIRFASTRLVAEELGLEHPGGVCAAMGRCLGYGAFFGLAAAVIVWELSEPIGFLWIGDARTVRSLRISALSMPCISLCSSISGYFTACGRVWKPTLIHLIEQVSGIALVAFFLNRVPAGDIEKSCAAVTLGRMAADVLSLILMALAYLLDRRGHYRDQGAGGRLTLRMLHIAVPLALSAYARSALTTLQHLLVPRGLKAAGFSANSALAGYGVIQGMVLPVIFFPSCILAAAAELIVPELTAVQVQHDGKAIRRTAGELLRLRRGSPRHADLRQPGRGALHPHPRTARALHVHGHERGRLSERPGAAGVEHGHQHRRRAARPAAHLAASSPIRAGGVYWDHLCNGAIELRSELRTAVEGHADSLTVRRC